jgi:hypothetical protein
MPPRAHQNATRYALPECRIPLTPFIGALKFIFLLKIGLKIKGEYKGMYIATLSREEKIMINKSAM